MNMKVLYAGDAAALPGFIWQQALRWLGAKG